MTKITPSERDAILRLDFLAFAQAAFTELYPGTAFERNWHHEAIAALLVQSNVRKTRKYINAPPRSLKSFLVSIAWVAFKLGHEPTHKFICASYSRDLANHLAAECRRLMQSEFYCRLFATRLVKIAEDELTTTKGGFRIATSVGATLTGLGGDTLIVDDPLNANDAQSDTNRKNANDWFTTTLMSRLNDKRSGAIFVVTQRLHQEDLTGILKEKGWDGLVLPAIAPRDTTIQIGSWSHSWKEGEPLQQDRESLKVLEDQKKYKAEVFAAQYMQGPVPESGNTLKREWIKWYEDAPVRQSGDRIVLSCDLAMKATGTSNYSVCLAFLVRNKNEYYLIDVWRQKVEFPELCAAIVEKQKKHQPNAILIEDHALGSPLIAQLRRYGIEGIVEIRPTADKRSRMEGETAKLQARSLMLPKAAPWLDEFLIEYVAFPSGKYDDQMDALSQFLNWRTTAEATVTFSCDWGGNYANPGSGGTAILGAPSPDELLWYLGR
jgi:predicted phage terminase large subunit-like protein